MRDLLHIARHMTHDDILGGVCLAVMIWAGPWVLGMLVAVLA